MRWRVEEGDVLGWNPSLGTLGNSKDQDSWSNWKRKCFRCSSPTNGPDAIFCHNFPASFVGLKVCHFSSCAKCYRNDPDLNLRVSRAFNAKSECYEQKREDE